MFTYRIPNSKDRLTLEKDTNGYAVAYLEHTHDYANDNPKGAFNVCNSQCFDNYSEALAVFRQRRDSADPFKPYVHPTTLEGWFAHSHCLNNIDKVREYVAVTAKKTGKNKVPYYFVNNLGRASYHSRDDGYAKYFKADNMLLHRFIMQTKGSRNPTFIGEVNDFTDSRLSHLKIVKIKTSSYVVGITEDEITFNVGDCEGAFHGLGMGGNNHIGFMGFHDLDGVVQETDEIISVSYVKSHVDNYGFSHMLFTELETARAYCEWAKQDKDSNNRYDAHRAWCEEMDDMEQYYGDHFDCDDDDAGNIFDPDFESNTMDDNHAAD